jgi:hypothetical protein
LLQIVLWREAFPAVVHRHVCKGGVHETYWYSLPKHQKIIRAELYWGIVDTLQAGEARASKVGRRVVLPRNFNGGERVVQARFLDAMTLVQWFQKTCYFITMTCNPYWEEVSRELFPGQTPQDRL